MALYYLADHYTEQNDLVKAEDYYRRLMDAGHADADNPELFRLKQEQFEKRQDRFYPAIN